MRALFIVNPAAGAGRALGRWRRVEAEVLAAHPGSEAVLTRGPGEAGDLAGRGREAGFEAVVAVGGDGTLMEAAGGLLGLPAGSPAPALATWPAGSGCDLARHFRVLPTAEALLGLLSRGRPRRLDAGLAVVTDAAGRPARRHFLSVAGLGLAAETAARAERGAKAWGGTAGYLAGALSALWRARPLEFEVSVDGGARRRELLHLLVLANTTSAGGGMRIAPAADPQDGALDLLSVGPLPRWELYRRLPSVYAGSHAGTPGVSLSLARTLEVSSPEGALVNLDGELAGRLPARFEVLPGALDFLAV